MADAADLRFMSAALRLARWNTGLTSTNPSVGCIVVNGGVIVGRGVTAPGGRPHAEPQALAEAGALARGATAYVTLEPCSHHGKTPPCANALIAAGVARVVIAVTDPDPRVSGRGVAMLREAGIVVETGIMEEEGRRVLGPYLTRQVEKRAHVTLKLAVSADGMIGRAGAGQVAITGPLARAQVHALRAETDAILVGIGTAVADDPELTVRLNGLASRSPHRFVIDPRLSLPVTSKLVRTAGDVPVTVVQLAARQAVSDTVDVEGGTIADRAEILQHHGVTLWQTPTLQSLLTRMADEGITSVMVEGGAKTARDFIKAGLVDRILLYEGPGTIGADGIASPITRAHMPDHFRLIATETFGPDRAYHYERED